MGRNLYATLISFSRVIMQWSVVLHSISTFLHHEVKVGGLGVLVTTHVVLEVTVPNGG